MQETKTSNAQKMATMKYAEKNLKRVPFTVQKSSYEVLRAEAENAGETVNGYIKRSIAMRMGRDFDSAKAAYTVQDIVDIGVKGLSRKSKLNVEPAKYAFIVIYEQERMVSDTPISDVGEEYLAREVKSWTVEADPQDVDSVIVRVYL